MLYRGGYYPSLKEDLSLVNVIVWLDLQKQTGWSYLFSRISSNRTWPKDENSCNIYFLYFYRERKELDSTQIANHNADIAAVVETISTMINPFDTDLEDLVNITSGEVARPDVKKDLLSASIIGEDKLDNFIKQKVTPEESEEPDIFSSIESTKLKSFSRKNVPVKAQTSKGKVVELKNDSKFIARLLAIGESREIDIENLMTYSLRKFPQPFATVNGELVKTAKVKLLHIIETRCQECLSDSLPPHNALILDGMAIVQTVKDVPQTFGALAEKIIQRIINNTRTSNASRVDFVSDLYPEISIKNLERSKRAESGSTHIKICSPSQKVPRQFKKFLSLGKNKEALVDFIYRFVIILMHITYTPLLN